MARHIEFRSLAHELPKVRRREPPTALARVSGVVYRQPVATAAVLLVAGVALWSLLHAREAQAASSPQP